MANTTGKKWGGRVKGTPNKRTSEVKGSLIEAFDNLGGVDALVEWAKDGNRGEFYKLWAKVLPVQKNDTPAEDNRPITIQIVKDD